MPMKTKGRYEVRKKNGNSYMVLSFFLFPHWESGTANSGIITRFKTRREVQAEANIYGGYVFDLRQES